MIYFHFTLGLLKDIQSNVYLFFVRWSANLREYFHEDNLNKKKTKKTKTKENNNNVAWPKKSMTCENSILNLATFQFNYL